MTLTAHVVVSTRDVDATVTVPDGHTLAVLGPNGSGKSTVLAAIAGVVSTDGGSTVLGGDRLHDHRTRTWVAPRERGIGLVTQGADLFPAMTVLDNVAFGIRAAGTRARPAREQAHVWLDRVDLTSVADRHPQELSGGQARRATLARALAARPRALLLDEPFAGVDVEAASSLRTLVADVTRDVTTIITTHDALDAHLLAGSVAVLEHGSVAESGPTATVLSRPRTDFAARMAGRFVLRGTVSTGGLELDDGTVVAAETDGVPAGARAAVALAAGDVELATERSVDTVADVVAWLEPRGDVVRVQGRRTAVDVTPAVAARLAPGAAVQVRTGLPRAYRL